LRHSLASGCTSIEHAVNETTTHVGAGAKGDSAGDLLTFANPVFDSTNKTQIGSDQGYCVPVAVGKSWECFWTLLLKESAITIEGPYHDSGDSPATTSSTSCSRSLRI